MQQLASSPSQQGWPSHGLMSLWGMIRAYAREFIVLTNVVDDLKSFTPIQYNALSPDAWQKSPEQQFYQKLRAMWPGLELLATRLPLPSVPDQIERIKLAVECQSPHYQVVSLLAALHDRLEDDLKRQMFFHVPAEHVKYYSPTPFGDDVAATFQDARGDFERSAKCLALQQGTASVFHLMRGFEIVVGVLAKRLGVSNAEREWGKLLSDIGEKIKVMPKSSEDEKRLKKSWSECHANLFHLKEACRNETMHPRRHYSQSEAIEVFEAMRTFIVQLIKLASV